MVLPILITAWKRPYKTLKLLNSLRDIRPNKVFIACDGPDLNNQEEIELVNQTRSILDNDIDWECEKYKLYNDFNRGIRFANSLAINWFFQSVPEGIILEDDCIPHPDFYKFTELLLNRFRHDKRIWTISGNNFQNGIWRGDGTYYLSKYPHCWGWATWRDRWKYYAQEEQIWQRLKDRKMLDTIFTSKRELKYWYPIFKKLYDDNDDKFNSWAYRWFLVCQAHGGLHVLPNQNLVENIGFDSSATNTKKGESPVELKSKNNESTAVLPLVEPSFLIRCEEADYYTFLNHFSSNIFIRIKRKLRSLLRNFLKFKI